MKEHKFRYQSAKTRLEKQLKSRVKPLKINGKTTDKTTALTKKDIVRIKAEIATLKDYLNGTTLSSRKKNKRSRKAIKPFNFTLSYYLKTLLMTYVTLTVIQTIQYYG